MTTSNPALRTAALALRAWLTQMMLFAPVLVFATWAGWNGPPTPERWVSAFQLGGLLAIKQTVTLMLLRRPLNRLMLGANLFLVSGAALAWLHLWQAFGVFAHLQASAVLAAMFAVGLVTTFASRAGFVGRVGASPVAVRRASLLLLAIAAGCFALAYGFRGERWLGATLPIMTLALSMRVMSARVVRAQVPA